MSLSDKQREARIKEKGKPKLSLEFDVFSDGSLSMWTHFDHGDDFEDVKRSLTAIRDHLTHFLEDEAMCPFHAASRSNNDPRCICCNVAVRSYGYCGNCIKHDCANKPGACGRAVKR